MKDNVVKKKEAKKKGVRSVASRAREVTFFEDRARVCRRAVVEVEAGVTTVELRGVSALVDAGGLVVRLGDQSSEGMTIKAAQVRRWLEERDEGDEGREEARKAEEEAKKAFEVASSVRDQWVREEEGLLELEASLLGQLQRVPTGAKVDAESWREAFDELEGPLDQVRQELREARRRYGQAERAWQQAQARLKAVQRVAPELVAAIEVQVDAERGGEVEIEAEYVVPCALWRPSHRARFTSGETPSVEITTLANVWQQTGERWEGIQARFSTARLARPASTPLLEDDQLVARQKSAEERKSIQVEAREQVIAEMSEGRRQLVEEMPGIDDGGRPLTFESNGAVTIVSDGEPLQIECGRTILEVTTESLVYPELMEAPHLVARGVWSGNTPLLAGPVTLIREGEFAGRTRQDFVSVGEPLKIGFGPQNAVRLQRRVDTRRGQSKLTGKQWIEKQITLYASNLSGQEQCFEVVERAPVSELDEVSVSVDAGTHRADADGFVRFSMTLGPRETRQERLGYRVEFGSKVELAL